MDDHAPQSRVVVHEGLHQHRTHHSRRIVTEKHKRVTGNPCHQQKAHPLFAGNPLFNIIYIMRSQSECRLVRHWESTDMTTRTVTMSHSELDRFGVITRVRERRLTQVEAARAFEN